MGLSIGQHVGLYEVVDRLGAGGMGEVYRARDRRLQRNVALKILPEAVARDDDRLARFTREAQTLAALNHPNIAAIYGIEDSGPVHAIAMELVEGEDAQAFSVAPDGTLLIRVHATITSSLGWADSSGRLSQIPGGPVGLQGSGLALSPDGRRAALVATSRGAVNLIVRDLQTGADTSLTFNRSTDVKGTWSLSHPAWFPSGDRLLYATGGVEAASRIFEQHVDVAGAPRELVAGVWASISPDSRTLFVINDVRATGHLSRKTIDTDGRIGAAEALVPDLDVDDLEPSPDGRTAAIIFHGERGRLEIGLITLDGTARQRVTTDGGTQPHFSADGRTLYYLVSESAANGRRAHRLWRVPVTSTTPLQIGKPDAVFGGSGSADRLDVSQYAIAGDGRLLVAVEDPASRRSRTVFVQNWPAFVSGR